MLYEIDEIQIPQAFAARMQELLKEEYQDFLESYKKPFFSALRINPLKTEREKFLKESNFRLEEVPWESNGFYYGEEDQPGKHPWHEAGVYYIQEPSAMLPVTFLKAEPGEKILDLCAAPGGKSTQIASAMRGEGILVCNEIHPQRARILSENIERMGVRNALVTNETPQTLKEVFPGYFDRILVDAPCSGEGMFRKREVAISQWSVENIEICANRQDEILDQASEMLRPGGTIVYSTCTFAPEEDEGSIQRFIERYPDFEVENTARFWPHKIKGEGHFAAVLKKAGKLPEGFHTTGRFLPEKGLTDKQIPEYAAFREQYIRGELAGRILKFGEQLYLVPEEMPSLHKLKVLRPGLHLGTLRKNRFEPSHALALALKREEVKDSVSFDTFSNEILGYLNGETFFSEGEKGWYLICADNYSIGWGKLAGGIMKNHYPKGLRKNLKAAWVNQGREE